MSITVTGRSARISKCGEYRFLLQRNLVSRRAIDRGRVAFVLNNPSTADGETDDATVRRGLSYADRWGYNLMTFVNVNPHRSTDPKAAWRPPERILKMNDMYLAATAVDANLVVVAWGNDASPTLVMRASDVLRRHAVVYALAVAKSGRPKHILYLSGDLQPEPYNI